MHPVTVAFNNFTLNRPKPSCIIFFSKILHCVLLYWRVEAKTGNASSELCFANHVSPGRSHATYTIGDFDGMKDYIIAVRRIYVGNRKKTFTKNSGNSFTINALILLEEDLYILKINVQEIDWTH